MALPTDRHQVAWLSRPIGIRSHGFADRSAPGRMALPTDRHRVAWLCRPIGTRSHGFADRAAPGRMALPTERHQVAWLSRPIGTRSHGFADRAAPILGPSSRFSCHLPPLRTLWPLIGGIRIEWNGQAQDGRRRFWRDEGIGPAGVWLPSSEEERHCGIWTSHGTTHFDEMSQPLFHRRHGIDLLKGYFHSFTLE